MVRGRGRQRISLERMQNESNLQVTFSKRRAGLFKKASELCTLCGAQVLIILFSPGNKPFSFGHPDVYSIIKKFSSGDQPPPPNDNTDILIERHRKAAAQDLNTRLTQVDNRLEAERKLSESLNQTRRSRQSQNWWEAPIEDQNLHQLQLLQKAMEDLKKEVAQKMELARIEEARALSFPGGTRSFGGVPFHAGTSTSRVGTTGVPFSASSSASGGSTSGSKSTTSRGFHYGHGGGFL